MVEIIPSILTDSASELAEMIDRVQGLVSRVHIDIMDGQFVDNETIDPAVVGEVGTSLLLDFHLSVKEPASWIKKCVNAGADRIIGHIEEMSSQNDFVSKVIEEGVQVGLAVDIETQLARLDEREIGNLDVILLMSYPTGFGGQPFDKRVLEKIKVMDSLRKKEALRFRICADGGIDEKTIGMVAKAGADEVAIGRRLFEGEVEANVKRYKSRAEKN